MTWLIGQGTCHQAYSLSSIPRNHNGENQLLQIVLWPFHSGLVAHAGHIHSQWMDGWLQAFKSTMEASTLLPSYSFSWGYFGIFSWATWICREGKPLPLSSEGPIIESEINYNRLTSEKVCEFHKFIICAGACMKESENPSTQWDPEAA